MTLSPDEIHELLRLAEGLAQRDEKDPSRLVLRLRDKLPSLSSTQCGALAETIVARNTGSKLGPLAASWILTRRGLEQASRPEIALHHAEQFKGRTHVLEIGSGLGVDTFHLAQAAKRVTSIERDPDVAAFARYNLRATSNVTILTGSAEEILPTFEFSDIDGLWADPARRDDSDRRLFGGEQYSPTLASILSLNIAGPVGIKVGPSVEFNSDGDLAREYIGFGHECLEKTLWRGTTVKDGTVFLADRKEKWEPKSTDISNIPTLLDPSSAKGSFLVEPHSALIASGNLNAFYEEFNISFFDPEIAYGISNQKPKTNGFLTSYSIVDTFPFSLKRIALELRNLGWNNHSVVKKRGFPEEPESILRKLQLPPPSDQFPGAGAIVLTRVGESHWVFLAKRCH